MQLSRHRPGLGGAVSSRMSPSHSASFHSAWVSRQAGSSPARHLRGDSDADPPTHHKEPRMQSPLAMCRMTALGVLAALALTACNNSTTSTAPAGGPTGTFTGTLVGATMSGVMTLSFPASASYMAAHLPRFRIVPVADAATVAATAVSVTGSLAITGGGTYTLSGTYDPSANPQLSVSSSLSGRSEEHTSELQSRLHLVCRLLLEKKKKTNTAVR